MRYPESGSFYELLGVPRDANSADIRAAFLKQAQRHHPDLNANDAGADRRFKQIRRIYEILIDPLKRAAYDDNPDRFRLADADIIFDDHGPIVTRPVHNRTAQEAWTARPRHGAGHLFRPHWLIDGRRFRRESRFVFAGVVSAMVVLSVIPVMLIRAHRIAMQAQNLSRHAARQETSPAETAAGEIAADAGNLVRLEQVIKSASDLRTGASAGPARHGREDSRADSREGDVLWPSFDMIDELNLPDPGWPIFSLPVGVPPETLPLPPPTGNDPGAGMPAVYSHVVQSSESGWSFHHQSAVDGGPRPDLPRVSFLPAPQPGDPRPFRDIIESDWSRVPPVNASAPPPYAALPNYRSLALTPALPTAAQRSSYGNGVSALPGAPAPPVSPEIRAVITAQVLPWGHPVLPNLWTGHQSTSADVPPYISASSPDVRPNPWWQPSPFNPSSTGRPGSFGELPRNPLGRPPSAPVGPALPHY